MNKIVKFPRYIRMICPTDGSEGTCLSLEKVDGDTATYFRHAGSWDAEVKWVGKELISVRRDTHPSISMKRCLRIKKQEWMDDNGEYVKDGGSELAARKMGVYCLWLTPE